MQMQSTYWLEKVLKMISFYVNALFCTLQHIVIHAMQLNGVCVCVRARARARMYVHYTAVLLLGDPLHSYQLNLKNVYVFYPFVLFPVVIVETRIICAFVY